MTRVLVNAFFLLALVSASVVPAAARNACSVQAQRQQLEAQKHQLDVQKHQLNAQYPGRANAAYRQTQKRQIDAQIRQLDAQKRQLNLQRKQCEAANHPKRHKGRDRDDH